MLISHEIVGSNPTASTKNKKSMEYKNGKKALVIGKFMPFHKGHKELIEFASIHANCVKILVLGNDNEPIDVKQRVQWIEDSFDLDYSLASEFIVKPITYDPTKLNSSSASDVKSSEEWCEFLKDELEEKEDRDILREPDVVSLAVTYAGILPANYAVKFETYIKNNLKGSMTVKKLESLILDYDENFKSYKQVRALREADGNVVLNILESDKFKEQLEELEKLTEDLE